MDTGATDHLTNNMGQLSTQERYQGRDQVQAANGAGMSITHVGNSKLAGSLELKNILHVPAISKNLLSVYRLVSDNNVFIEFHKYFFFVKTRSRRESSFAVEVGVDSIAPRLIEPPPGVMHLLVSSFHLVIGISVLVIRHRI
jgi:hypothetical protein